MRDNMIQLASLAHYESRSISPENLSGERGKGGGAKHGTAADAASELGRGWKINPFIILPAQQETCLADFRGSGVINHMWLTPSDNWHDLILCVYWDSANEPSIECPLDLFFCADRLYTKPIRSLAMCVNPSRGFNSYFDMPFHDGFRITLRNRGTSDETVYYQIDFVLCDLPTDTGRLNASVSQSLPLKLGDVHELMSVKGRGKYVGTHLIWEALSLGWWGEGEMKFYTDDDRDWPTICTTGLEDYFGGSHGFERPKGTFLEYSNPYTGFTVLSDDLSATGIGKRFSMYRWHIPDPIYFSNSLKVTCQSLGWDDHHKYRQREDNIRSVVYWYSPWEDEPCG